MRYMNGVGHTFTAASGKYSASNRIIFISRSIISKYIYVHIVNPAYSYNL